MMDFEEAQSQADDAGLSVPAVLEKEVILLALDETNGNYAAAAKLLRMPKSTFYDRCGRYNIRPQIEIVCEAPTPPH